MAKAGIDPESVAVGRRSKPATQAHFPLPAGPFCQSMPWMTSTACRCDKCGIETNVEEVFYKIEHPHSNRVTRRCPDCWVKSQRFGGLIYLVRHATVGCVGLLLVSFDSSSAFGWFLLNLFLFRLFLSIVIVPHELGHAFAARALGLRVFKVVIGYGRKVYEWPFGGFKLEVRSFPLGGYAFATHKDTRWYRSRDFLFTLAGPMANILFGMVTIRPPRH
jgi:hypothetical protein